MQAITFILVIAVIWFFSGWLMGVALRALFGVEWVAVCSALNLAVGMILLRLFTLSQREQEILLDGSERLKDESSLACILIAIPGTVMILAIAWIVVAFFIQ